MIVLTRTLSLSLSRPRKGETPLSSQDRQSLWRQAKAMTPIVRRRQHQARAIGNLRSRRLAPFIVQRKGRTATVVKVVPAAPMDGVVQMPTAARKASLGQ